MKTKPGHFILIYGWFQDQQTPKKFLNLLFQTSFYTVKKEKYNMKWIIPDHEYKERMEKDVEPWLESIRQTRRLSRNKNEWIYTESYKLPQSKGMAVISHGYTEACRKYYEVIYYFLKEGYDVYIMDHCGHGKSYRLTDSKCPIHIDTKERYIEDFTFFCRRIKEENPGKPFHIYCHSMGGGIGLTTAGRNPDLFDTITASSPMVRPKVLVPSGLVTAAADFLNHFKLGTCFVPGQKPYKSETFKQSCMTSKDRFDYYQPIRDENEYLHTSGYSWKWAGEACRFYKELLQIQEKGLGAPLLLFQAGKENLVDNKASTRFVKEISKKSPARLEVVKNAKHEIYCSESTILENYFDQIFRFLNSKDTCAMPSAKEDEKSPS